MKPTIVAVISNVDSDAGQIAGLVYLNGFAPAPGENCFGLADGGPHAHAGRARARAVRSALTLPGSR